MTKMEKFKILAEFIKDISSETKDAKTYLFVKDYISKYQLLSDSKNQKESLLVYLKYNNGLPVIKEIKRISKPGRRIYARASSIPEFKMD